MSNVTAHKFKYFGNEISQNDQIGAVIGGIALWFVFVFVVSWVSYMLSDIITCDFGTKKEEEEGDEAKSKEEDSNEPVTQPV